jgi:hypothetical protein
MIRAMRFTARKSSSQFPTRRLRARRGAMLMIVGLFFIGLIAVGTMSIDMSRLGNLQAELQVSADAGAHAGMVQYLINPGNTGAIIDSARAYAQRNLALEAIPNLEPGFPEMGFWNGSDFIPGGSPANAIRVRVSYQLSGMIMEVVGATPPLVRATTVATTLDNFPASSHSCGIATPGPPGFRTCPVFVR